MAQFDDPFSTDNKTLTATKVLLFSTRLNMTISKGKRLAKFFFTFDRMEVLFWICGCDKTRQQKSSGYAVFCLRTTSEHATKLNKVSLN